MSRTFSEGRGFEPGRRLIVFTLVFFAVVDGFSDLGSSLPWLSHVVVLMDRDDDFLDSILVTPT